MFTAGPQRWKTLPDLSRSNGIYIQLLLTCLLLLFIDLPLDAYAKKREMELSNSLINTPHVFRAEGTTPVPEKQMQRPQLIWPLVML